MTLRLVGVVGELDVVANFISCAAGLHGVFALWIIGYGNLLVAS